METNIKTERKGMEEMIQKKRWFRLLPKDTQRSLLERSGDYLALLLKQENVIVTTNDETDFAFGYKTEDELVIRIPEFSTSRIGVNKLKKLKLLPEEKMRFIIENRSLLERPLSLKNKKLVVELLKTIGDIKLWDLGSMVEEKTRDIQLRIDTGIVEINYLPSTESKQAEWPEIILRNYLWLWQQIYTNCKRAEFHISVSSLCCLEDTVMRIEKEKSPFLFQIHYSPFGRNVLVSAIGPFSALKIASSFPIDDPDRLEFWERKWDHWQDAETFSTVGHLQVMQRKDHSVKPEIFEYICPKCNGEGTDSEVSTEYKREINEVGDFKCWRCHGVGMIDKNDEGNPINRFFDSLKYIREREGVGQYKSLLNDLLPHLNKEASGEIWRWSSVYYPCSRAVAPEPLIRIIALPVANAYLEIRQQIIREDPIWAQGDLMGVTDDVEKVTIELRVKTENEIGKDQVEFQTEAENLLKKWEVEI